MSLQDQIDEELKSVIITDPMTPEERAYFSTLKTDEDMDNFIKKINEKNGVEIIDF